MMRKVFSVALMASVACAFGLVQNANAAVTIDVLFQDAVIPSGITISPGDVGTGCDFGGFAGGSVSTGYCMDIVLTSNQDMTAISMAVSYDSDNGLALDSIYAWKGAPVGWSAGRYGPVPTPCATALFNPTDTGATIESFGCIVGPPSIPPVIAQGTYRIGTLVWDATATTAGSETVAAFLKTGQGVGVAINGVSVLLNGLPGLTLGTHILTIIPEPGTASLLGLGLVGLILAGRRSRA